MQSLRNNRNPVSSRLEETVRRADGREQGSFSPAMRTRIKEERKATRVGRTRQEEKEYKSGGSASALRTFTIEY